MGGFIHFVEIDGIYKSYGNLREYAKCIIGSREWTPLSGGGGGGVEKEDEE